MLNSEPRIPRSRLAEQQRGERRRQLLDAARLVFAEKGYSGASVGDVIEKADVARGTFYLYFPSKRAIFDALLEEVLTEFVAVVRRVDVSPGAHAPMLQLEENIVRLMDLVSRRPEVLRILLWEAVGLDDASEEKVVEFHQRMFALTRRSLVTGMEIGIVRSCDPDLAARALVGSLKEVMVSLLVRRDLPPTEFHALARNFLDVTLFGLMAR